MVWYNTTYYIVTRDIRTCIELACLCSKLVATYLCVCNLPREQHTQGSCLVVDFHVFDGSPFQLSAFALIIQSFFFIQLVGVYRKVSCMWFSLYQISLFYSLSDNVGHQTVSSVQIPITFLISDACLDILSLPLLARFLKCISSWWSSFKFISVLSNSVCSVVVSMFSACSSSLGLVLGLGLASLGLALHCSFHPYSSELCWLDRHSHYKAQYQR